MKFEKKFITYSFIIIFALLLLLISSITYNMYKTEKHFLIDKIKNRLEICSYKLNCPNTKIDFIKQSNALKLLKLYETEKEFYMIFRIPEFQTYYLKLSYPKTIYYQKLKLIKYF